MDIAALKDPLERVIHSDCLKPPGHIPGSNSEEESLLMEQTAETELVDSNEVYLSWVDGTLHLVLVLTAIQ